MGAPFFIQGVMWKFFGQTKQTNKETNKLHPLLMPWVEAKKRFTNLTSYKKQKFTAEGSEEKKNLCQPLRCMKKNLIRK